MGLGPIIGLFNALPRAAAPRAAAPTAAAPKAKLVPKPLSGCCFCSPCSVVYCSSWLASSTNSWASAFSFTTIWVPSVRVKLAIWLGSMYLASSAEICKMTFKI